MKTPVGGSGIPTPDSPKPASFPYNSMEEVASVLRTGVDKLLELSASKDKEFQTKLLALSSKREADLKEAAAKQNKLSADLEKQKERIDFLQAENDKLAKVIFRTISVSVSRKIFLFVLSLYRF